MSPVPHARPRCKPAILGAITLTLFALSIVGPAVSTTGAATDAVTTTATTPKKPRLFVLGDSVLLGAVTTISTTLGADWDVLVDAQKSRFLDDAVDVFVARRAEIGDVVVIHQGTNYGGSRSAFRADIDRAMFALGTVKRVVFINVGEFSQNRDDVNAELDDAARRYAPRVTVADWRVMSTTLPGLLAGDDIHLTSTGAQAMANLIKGAVSTVRSTARYVPPLPTTTTTPPVKAAAPAPAPTTASTAPCVTRPDSNPPASPSEGSASGYWLLDTVGRANAFDAPWLGDLVSLGIRTTPTGIAATPSGSGYWIVDQRGVVWPFGDAPDLGGLGRIALNAPIKRIEATRSGLGYWLVAADGGVFAFGDARFSGSLGSLRLNAPIISFASDPDGVGYWLVAADGGVFAFDAPFLGSTGDRRLNAPVLSMAARSSGDGYWLYARDGGVFAFGSAPFLGSLPGLGQCPAPVAMQLRASASGRGYWVATPEGRVFAFGDAQLHGDRPVMAKGATVVDFAVRAGASTK